MQSIISENENSFPNKTIVLDSDEESLTASELEELKNPSQLETTGGLTLGKGTEDEESLTASELKEIKSGGVVFVIAKGNGEVGRTTRALTKGDAIEISKALKINNLTPNKKYAFINALSDNSGTDFRFIETAPLYPSTNYVYEANESGEISITFVFHGIALTSLSQYTIIEGQYYITLLEINDSVDTTITIN